MITYGYRWTCDNPEIVVEGNEYYIRGKYKREDTTMSEKRIEIAGLVGWWFKPDDGIARKTREAIIGTDGYAYVEGVKSTRCNKDKAWWRFRDVELLPADWQPERERERELAEAEGRRLVGRYVQFCSQKAKILKVEYRNGALRFLPGWETKGWTRTGADTWQPVSSGCFKLLGPAWTPTPERKEEPSVDPLAVKLRQFYTHRWDCTDLGGGANIKWYTDEAAQIRKMLGAEALENVRAGWKLVRKEGNGYISCRPGIMGKSVAYVLFEWTRQPAGEHGLCLFATEEDARTFHGKTGCAGSTHPDHIARCLYVPTDDGFEAAREYNSVFASAVMLLEEPVPVKDVGEQTPDAIYPSADELRDIIWDAWNEVESPNNSGNAAKAVLAHFRTRGVSPVRVCTVSDETGEASLHTAWMRCGWDGAWRKARELLGATTVADYVVEPRPYSPESGAQIRLLTQKAEAALGEGYHQNSHGAYGFEGDGWCSLVARLCHAGCVGLLDENCKEPK